MRGLINFCRRLRADSKTRAVHEELDRSAAILARRLGEQHAAQHMVEHYAVLIDQTDHTKLWNRYADLRDCLVAATAELTGISAQVEQADNRHTRALNAYARLHPRKEQP